MSNKKSFGLIVNYNAGKVKSGVYKREFFEKTFGNDCLIRETKVLDDVLKALKEFQDFGVEYLIIFGGDGTHQNVITQILRSNIVFKYIVPLKGGTMNMLVKDIGLGNSYIKVIKKLKELYSCNSKEILSFEKPVLSVTVNSEESHYGFYFANGVIYKILKKYYESPSSVYNAMKVTLKGLLGSFISSHSYSNLFDFIDCNVIHDEQIHPQSKYLGIMLSTLNRVVFNMKPFIQKINSKDQFCFTGYAFPKKDLIRHFIPLAKGKLVKGSKVYSLTPKTLVLECDTGFVLDGEIHNINEPSKINIEIGGYLNIPIITAK
ncbi:MAG: diacylglycerol kinase family protein [Spirochaetota bacterium]|nr:diacylglycerol kinase family protein [Spirochaetota bacterium]